MIKARKERVREVIRSLESIQVRSQALCKEESTLEGWSSSLTEIGAGKNDAAHSRSKASDDAAYHVRSRNKALPQGSRTCRRGAADNS